MSRAHICTQCHVLTIHSECPECDYPTHRFYYRKDMHSPLLVKVEPHLSPEGDLYLLISKPSGDITVRLQERDLAAYVR